jgi:alcohol dehydrogenase, propanol-preferring
MKASSYVGMPDELRELVALARDGKIKPIPIRNEPIETLNDGLGQLRAGKVTGRIVHLHRSSR